MTTKTASFVRGKESLLATADLQGTPHLALGRVDAAGPGRLEVSGWFCPQTLANLGVNPAVSVTARGPHEGYQLVGRVVEKAVDALMDGYEPGEEPGVPQVRYRLTVAVEKTMAMGDRPHSDRDLA